MEGGDSGLIAWVWIWQVSILSDKVFHGEHAAHPSGVITEEDAAKGSKSTDEVGLDGDGGFDTRGICGPSNYSYSAATHVCDICEISER